MIEVKGQHGGTYSAVCPRAAERLSPAVVDRGVGTDEGRRMVVVDESDAWRVREGRRHDRKSTAGFRRERVEVLGGWSSLLMSAGKSERVWG